MAPFLQCVNYFFGMLGALFEPMDDPATRYSTALPDLKQFPGRWRRLPVLATRADMHRQSTRSYASDGAANVFSRTGGGSYRDYISTAHKIAITYSDQYNPRVIAGQGWGADSPLEGSQAPKSIHDRTGRVNYDYIVRSNLLNHLTVGVDSHRNETRQLSQAQGWNTHLGIQGIVGDQGAFPVINFSGCARVFDAAGHELPGQFTRLRKFASSGPVSDSGRARAAENSVAGLPAYRPGESLNAATLRPSAWRRDHHLLVKDGNREYVGCSNVFSMNIAAAPAEKN